MHINRGVHLRGLQFGGFSGGLISTGVISGIPHAHAHARHFSVRLLHIGVTLPPLNALLLPFYFSYTELP